MGCASSSETSATTGERPDSSMRIANNQSSNSGATTENQQQPPQRCMLTDDQLEAALELPELANPLVIGLPTTHDQPAAGDAKIYTPRTPAGVSTTAAAADGDGPINKQHGLTRTRPSSFTSPPAKTTTSRAADGRMGSAEGKYSNSFHRPCATSHGSNALPRRHNSMSSPKLRPGKSPSSSQSRIHHHHSGEAILDAAPAFLDRIASSLGSAPTSGLASASRSSAAFGTPLDLEQTHRDVGTSPSPPFASSSASPTPAEGSGCVTGLPGSPRVAGLARTPSGGLSRSRSSTGLNVTFAAVLRTDGTQ